MADPTIESKISIIKEDVTKFSKSVETFVVSDAETQTKAIDFLSQIKVRLKRIEALRKEFTVPLNDQVKKINNMFKAQSEPLAELEVKVNSTLKTYMDEEARKAQIEADRLYKIKKDKEDAEAKKIQDAQDEADRLREEADKTKDAKEKARLEKEAKEADAKQEEATEALEQTELQTVEAPKKSVRTESGMATRKMVWKWKVVDYIKLRKAHPELFLLDEKAMNKMVSEGERDIPGVDVFQESQLAIKA